VPLQFRKLSLLRFGKTKKERRCIPLGEEGKNGFWADTPKGKKALFAKWERPPPRQEKGNPALEEKHPLMVARRRE